MPPPQPMHNNFFDAWNSSSTGHQRAENRLGRSTGWRQSRNMKLSHQFKSGDTGGKRMSDTIGAGSEDWDEKAKAMIPKDIRARAKMSVGDMLMLKTTKIPMTNEEKLMAERKREDDIKEFEKENGRKGVFAGLVIHINGSTAPLISDHKLKHILAENGAQVSLHLGRRKVSHVILGKPSSNASGAGGGLSASKLQKEIKRIGGCGVKYVGVEWVLESMKAGKRLSETPYINLKIAPKGQQSVYGMLTKSPSTGSGNSSSIP
ncbi:hypothetical protein B0O99DRAFT_232137 [Bisporella sp. PMI_857]|nr:hypothetical protein B0O99DRAFT_232137 [Bisporella sp. PMI_857]